MDVCRKALDDSGVVVSGSRQAVLCDSTKVTKHCSPVDGVSPCITFVLDALVAVILEVG